MSYLTTFEFPEDNDKNSFTAFGKRFTDFTKVPHINMGLQTLINMIIKPLPDFDKNFVPTLEEIELTKDLSIVIDESKDLHVYFGGLMNSTLEFKILQKGKEEFTQWIDEFRSTAVNNEFSEFSLWMQDKFGLRPLDNTQEFWITKINNTTFEFTANEHTSYLSDSSLIELVNFLISDYFG